MFKKRNWYKYTDFFVRKISPYITEISDRSDKEKSSSVARKKYQVFPRVSI